MINVLFLCTGNSARSILAESYLNHAGRGKLRAYSAGSFPKGAIHPFSLDTLREANVAVGEARSKSWDEFAKSGAPRMNLVITICDNAAGEVCPIWPGAPAKAHWSFPDLAAVDGNEAEKRARFAEIFADIRQAIDRLLAVPVDHLRPPELAKHAAESGPR